MANYQIQKGDTLSEIAQRSGSSVDELLKANPYITNRDKIYTGNTLNIPGANTVTQPVEQAARSNAPVDGLAANLYSPSIAKVESGDDYTAVNPTSGAYGKYQFIPSTAREYATKLGLEGDSWKTPENQEKMFSAFMADNIRGLQNKNLEVNPFTVYGAHQQGLTGFSNIMAGNLTNKLEANMRSNLPNQFKGLQGMDLRNAWVNYWRNRMTT